MKDIRKRALVVTLSLFAFMVSQMIGGTGAVICIDADGHAAFEWFCDCNTRGYPAPDKASEDASHDVEAHLISSDDCGPCVPVPLGVICMTSDYWSDCFFQTHEVFDSERVFIAPRALSFEPGTFDTTPSPRLCGPLALLSTTILLI